MAATVDRGVADLLEPHGPVLVDHASRDVDQPTSPKHRQQVLQTALVVLAVTGLGGELIGDFSERDPVGVEQHVMTLVLRASRPSASMPKNSLQMNRDHIGAALG